MSADNSSRLRTGAEASTEALLYLLTLVFWIAAIGSLVLISRPKGLDSTQV
jgi:hypothetical protein